MAMKQKPGKRIASTQAGSAPPKPVHVARVIRIPKTAEIVAGHIRKMIIRGELKDGAFLQPEAQLMAEFGTSRPTIREAFRILESEQFISVTRGSRSGARVHHPSVDSVARLAGFVLQCQGVTIGDVYEARLTIEPHAAFLAAERSGAKGVTRLRAELEELQRLLDSGAFVNFRKAVARFHEVVVHLSGNKTLSLVFAMLLAVQENHHARFAEPVDERATPADRRKSALQGLRSMARLIDLIEARDASGAEAHWRRHVENANKRWLTGYDQAAVVDVLD
jgi:DNA-binding FadR family transcriptional regulator